MENLIVWYNKSNMIISKFIAETLDVIGVLLIAYTALKVHHRVWKSHHIDNSVFKAMRKEQLLGVTGIILIVSGYLLKFAS